MEGLALSEQVDIELVPGVPLYSLGQELDGKIADKARYSLHRSRSNDSDDSDEQSRKLPTGRGNDVESPAHVDLDIAVAHIVHNRSGDRDQGQEGIARQVGKHPSKRSGVVVAVLPFDSKLSSLHSAIKITVFASGFKYS